MTVADPTTSPSGNPGPLTGFGGLLQRLPRRYSFGLASPRQHTYHLCVTGQQRGRGVTDDFQSVAVHVERTRLLGSKPRLKPCNVDSGLVLVQRRAA